ncbi:MAG: cysteine hydrolase family protein [Gaiellales bacterium]
MHLEVGHRNTGFGAVRDSWETTFGDPDGTALLVIDMQNDFVADGGVMDRVGTDLRAAQAIIPTAATLIEAARDIGVLVVFVKNTNLPFGRSTGEAELARRLSREIPADITLAGSWGAQLIPQLQLRDGDVVVTKHRRSGFFSTDLDMVLRANRRDAVVCVGLATPACVLATALDATHRDLFSFVAQDCVAGYSEQLHEAAMAVLRTHVTGVVTADILRSRWASR